MTDILLVQSCSETKDESVSGAVPARDLYTGYFHRIIGKAHRENAIHDRINMVILSAEHGIIDPDERIEYYDRRMTADRATELNEEVLESLEGRVKGAYDVVVVNAGKQYREALEGISDLPVAVYVNHGSGNGEMGSKLKSFLRTADVDEFREWPDGG